MFVIHQGKFLELYLKIFLAANLFLFVISGLNLSLCWCVIIEHLCVTSLRQVVFPISTGLTAYVVLKRVVVYTQFTEVGVASQTQGDVIKMTVFVM